MQCQLSDCHHRVTEVAELCIYLYSAKVCKSHLRCHQFPQNGLLNNFLFCTLSGLVGFSLGHCRKKTALKMFPLCLFFLLSFCYQILTRSQDTIPHPSLILLLLVFAKCYSLTTKYCYHSDFRIIQSGFNKHAKISCNMPAKNV